MALQPEQMPEWLQQLLQRQEIAIATLVEKVGQLEGSSQLPDPRVDASITTNSPIPQPSVNTSLYPSDSITGRRPKPRLPNPESFDGKNLAYYPQFEGLLRAKLDIDGTAIGGERERVWYRFGRLAGAAGSRIYPEINAFQAPD